MLYSANYELILVDTWDQIINCPYARIWFRARCLHMLFLQSLGQKAPFMSHVALWLSDGCES